LSISRNRVNSTIRGEEVVEIEEPEAYLIAIFYRKLSRKRLVENRWRF